MGVPPRLSRRAVAPPATRLKIRILAPNTGAPVAAFTRQPGLWPLRVARHEPSDTAGVARTGARRPTDLAVTAARRAAPTVQRTDRRHDAGRRLSVPGPWDPSGRMIDQRRVQ